MFRSAAPPAPRPLRVLIVDDDPRFSELVALLLDDDGRTTVVGFAENGAEGVELALRLRPDVVVMDIQMPVMDGITATRRIRTQLHGTRVVLVTGDSDPGHVRAARLAGATFLRKGFGPDELVDAVAGRRHAPLALTLARPLPAA